MHALEFRKGSPGRFTSLLLFVLGLPSIVWAEQLPIKTYTTSDGLAQNLIDRIVRDTRRYLWFCTAEGLSRFDGYRFTNYTTDQGLPHRSIRDLLETRSGVYWVATGDGLVRFNANSSRSRNSAEPMFVVHRPGEGHQTASITVLYEDRTGTVWCGTSAGLYKLEEAHGQVKFRLVEMGMPTKTGDDRLVEDILEDRNGSLWVGTRGSGLYRRLPDGRVEHYSTRHGLLSHHVNALLEDRQGRLWVGMNPGLCLLVPEPDLNRLVVDRRFGKQDFGLSSDWIEALFQSSDGRLWIGISGGLTSFTPAAEGDEQHFRSYSTANGLSHPDLTSLAEDSGGNLWIGASNGAMRLARNGFVSYIETNLGTSLDLASIVETKSGELCFIAGSHSAGRLIRFEEKGLLTIRPNLPKRLTYFGWGWSQFGLQDREENGGYRPGTSFFAFPRWAVSNNSPTCTPKLTTPPEMV